jgi:putative methyltransferase (TIGR04325 family)
MFGRGESFQGLFSFPSPAYSLESSHGPETLRFLGREGKNVNVLRGLATGWLPPVIQEIRKRRRNRKKIYGWFGDYSSWEEAQSVCTGYDSANILEKVKRSLLAVKNGKAVYERDSVLFDRIQYSWPVLAGLLWAAARNMGRLSVLDFGGSLGSGYFQNRKFLEQLPAVRWSVVEQEHFISCGKEHFEDERLGFYPTIAACVAAEKPNVVLLSSVLPYLRDPYGLLRELFSFKIPLIVTDLTGFFEELPTRITVQRVNPKIYEGSYPCWIFNEKEFLDVFSEAYNVEESFPSYINHEFYIDNDEKLKAGYRGFIFQRRIHE